MKLLHLLSKKKNNYNRASFSGLQEVQRKTATSRNSADSSRSLPQGVVGDCLQKSRKHFSMLKRGGHESSK